MVILMTLIFLVIVAAAVSAVVTQSLLRGRQDPALGAPGGAAGGATEERLRRLEATVESLTAEVERMSEGQRFLTEVLAKRGKLPPPDEWQ